VTDGAPELEEDVDLTPEIRKYVLETHDRLDKLTHYALLEVAIDVDKKTLRRAYFRLAGLVHPDRFFGKRLGSYKRRIDTLFARITEAHETLSSPERRAKYDAKIGAAAAPKTAGVAAPVSAPVPAAPPPKAPVPLDPKVAAERKAAMEALKLRFQQGKGTGQKHAEMANRARAAGDFVAAAEAYRAALTYEPNNAVLRAAYDETKKQAAQIVRESHRKKALLEERYGHWSEAAASWQQLVALDPDDADARARLETSRAKSQPKRES
jgi:curved DNA-binding protein CbpA